MGRRVGEGDPVATLGVGRRECLAPAAIRLHRSQHQAGTGRDEELSGDGLGEEGQPSIAARSPGNGGDEDPLGLGERAMTFRR